jgi:hypothetical protein
MISMVSDMAGQQADDKFKALSSFGPSGKSTAKRGVQTKGWDLAGDIKKGAQSIGSGVDRLVKNPGEAIAGAAQHIAGETTPGGKAVKDVTSALQNANRTTPEDPMAGILRSQQEAYKEYQSKLPEYQQKISENLGQQANIGMHEAQRGVEQRNVSRGLGYGNLNESMKEQERSRSQQQLAGSLSNANVGLLDLGNQIRSGAIQTGQGMQQELQNRQNQVYQRELANQQAQNSAAGNMMGLLGTIGLASAFGPAGAMAGSQLTKTR